jgi:hypothetical protein
MCDALLDMQDKKLIFLPYNHQYVYPNSYLFPFDNHKSNLHVRCPKCSNRHILIEINLDKSTIRIYDSKRLGQKI